MNRRLLLSIVGFAGLVPAAALAQAPQQKIRPPIATYGVDVATSSMSIPGMPSGAGGGAPGGGGLGGLMGGMMGGGMGAMGGAAGMGGGMGPMGGPQKTLHLGLRSSQKPGGTPEAEHQIPPGMNMGPSLPLTGLPPTPPGQTLPGEERAPEKPKARLLVYWGCGDAIRPGQPRVADTSKMSLEEFGRALFGRSPPDRWHALRNAQLAWPNERQTKPVPAEASLRGDQLVKGNATPDMRFAIGERQDFLAPVELAAATTPAGSTAVEWRSVPHAQGYFLQAFASKSDGEMIIWSSSEVHDTGWGLMDYLPNDFLRRMIDEKVVLPASTTRCTIPKGVYDGVEGAMLRAIAYGEELNLVHPPRPSDPKVTWEQVWAVKVRVKSTGMTPLGMDAGDAGQGASGSRTAQDPSTARGEPQGTQPAAPSDQIKDTVDKLRGILRF
jgi:hypothetical protein